MKQIIFKKISKLTDEDKKKVSDMTGKIIIWCLEGRSIGYMSEKLGLHPWQIEHNIDETLYTLRGQVGIRRFLRILFWK